MTYDANCYFANLEAVDAPARNAAFAKKLREVEERLETEIEVQRIIDQTYRTVDIELARRDLKRVAAIGLTTAALIYGLSFVNIGLAIVVGFFGAMMFFVIAVVGKVWLALDPIPEDV